MISAYHAYLIDPEFYRLDFEADRLQHHAEVTSLACLFDLLSPTTSNASYAQTGGSHFTALLGAVVGINAAIRVDDNVRELEDLLNQRHARVLADINRVQPV